MSCSVCGCAVSSAAVLSHSLTVRRPGGVVQQKVFHPECAKRVQKAQIAGLRARLRDRAMHNLNGVADGELLRAFKGGA